MATGLRIWDRLILFLAWTVTCGLVYLLGFYVGKGVQAQRVDTEERIVKLPISNPPPPPAGQRPKSDLTFYDTLAKSGDRPAQPTPEPAPPPKAPTGTLPPRAAAPSTIAPAPVPTTTVPAPRPTTTVPPPRAAAPPPTMPPRPAAATLPPPNPPAARPAERATPAPAEQRATKVEPPPTSTRGTWSVQAAPTRSRDDADALLKRLRSKGYDASIVEVPRDGATWYRIRVGRYASAGQATEAMQRLRDQEGVSHVFVASE